VLGCGRIIKYGQKTGKVEVIEGFLYKLQDMQFSAATTKVN
jgi:hypothetical protein